MPGPLLRNRRHGLCFEDGSTLDVMDTPFGRFGNRHLLASTCRPGSGVWTAFPLGILVTGADLPNAFPYFIAIERMSAADIDIPVGLFVLAGYSLVYCIPCLILLALGLAHGDKVRSLLRKVLDRFSTGTVKRSIPTAIALFVLSTAFLTIVLLP